MVNISSTILELMHRLTHPANNLQNKTYITLNSVEHPCAQKHYFKFNYIVISLYDVDKITHWLVSYFVMKIIPIRNRARGISEETTGGLATHRLTRLLRNGS